MTDAHLMDADCIHGNPWWACPVCDEEDRVEAEARAQTEREAAGRPPEADTP